jgi:hypothetical protein
MNEPHGDAVILPFDFDAAGKIEARSLDEHHGTSREMRGCDFN